MPLIMGKLRRGLTIFMKLELDIFDIGIIAEKRRCIVDRTAALFYPRFGMDDLKLCALADLRLKLLLGAGDSEHLVIEEFFDPECHLDIASAIAPLARAVLLRRQRRKLGFPVSEHMGLDPDQVADFADLKVDLFRYDYGRMWHSC